MAFWDHVKSVWDVDAAFQTTKEMLAKRIAEAAQKDPQADPTSWMLASISNARIAGLPEIDTLLVIVASISVLAEPFRVEALAWFLLTRFGRHDKIAAARFVECMRPAQELAERGQLAPTWERANPYFAKHSPRAGLLVAAWQVQLAQEGRR